MPVRMITQAERLACEKIQSVAFAYPLDTEKHENESAGETGYQNPCIGFFGDDHTVTACMELPEFQMRYEGHWVRMTGIGGVASLPEYRFGGAVRQMFHYAFRRMQQDGTVFSSLYPFSHPYYRKLGYETCQLSSLEHEFPIAALSKFRCKDTVRMLQPGDSTEALQTVFDAHFRRYNMPVLREARHWEKLLGSDPYKERVYGYLLENAEGPTAYIVLDIRNDGAHNKICHVREAAFVRPESLWDILGFLYRLSAQFGTVLLQLPDDIPLSALLDETHDLKSHYSNQQMSRVINVQKALELKRHFDGAAYTLRVRDDGIEENDGFFRVRCENGAVHTVKTDDTGPADLTADVRTLGQLLLGSLSIDEALYKSDVAVHANLETLRGVFVQRHVFLTEYF